MKNMIYMMSPTEGHTNLARSLLGATCLWHRTNYPDRAAELVVTGDFLTGGRADESIVRALMMAPGHEASLAPFLFERVDVLAGGAEFALLYEDWRDGTAGADGRYCSTIDPYYGEEGGSEGLSETCCEWLSELPTCVERGAFLIASSASEQGREYDRDWGEREWDQHLEGIASRLEVVVGDYDHPEPVLRGRRLNISTGISRPGGNLTVVALDPENEDEPIAGVLRLPRTSLCPEVGEYLIGELEFSVAECA